jgi:hypothetical protein
MAGLPVASQKETGIDRLCEHCDLESSGNDLRTCY